MDLLSQIRSECANLSVNKDYLGRYPLAETKSLFVPTRYGSLFGSPLSSSYEKGSPTHYCEFSWRRLYQRVSRTGY